jgi:hypothetical protein
MVDGHKLYDIEVRLRDAMFAQMFLASTEAGVV